MKVAKYRQLIEHGERLVNADYHACVGERELIGWFKRCFLVMTELSEAECKTAKEDDKNRKEILFDRFSQRVDTNFTTWEKARDFYLSAQGVSVEDVDKCSEDLKRNTADIKKYSHEVKLYRSALKHWGGKADEFTIRLWKRRMCEASDLLGNAVLRGEELKKHASELIRLVGGEG